MMGILLTKIRVAIFQKYKGANHVEFAKMNKRYQQNGDDECRNYKINFYIES